MKTIGFIGMGNMGYALLKGVLKEFPSEKLIFTAKTSETKLRVHAETQVVYAESNAECANNCKYVVLAVKPQYYPTVLKQIRYAVTPDHVIISLAPGITIASLKETLGSDRRIVRAMPNTPALIGEGMTGLSYDAEEFSQDEIDMVHRIFGAVGKYADVEERLMSPAEALRPMCTSSLRHWRMARCSLAFREPRRMLSQPRRWPERRRWCWRPASIRLH